MYFLLLFLVMLVPSKIRELFSLKDQCVLLYFVVKVNGDREVPDTSGTVCFVMWRKYLPRIDSNYTTLKDISQYLIPDWFRALQINHNLLLILLILIIMHFLEKNLVFLNSYKMCFLILGLQCDSPRWIIECNQFKQFSHFACSNYYLWEMMKGDE